MTTLFKFYKVECNHVWDDEDAVETHTFGSEIGARRWAEANKAELRWYSIEGLSAHPCNEDDPGGKLFYGMLYHEFREVH